MIGLCTDSNSQLPPELAERYGVEVVPLTVIADEHEYLEGVSIDADGFYELFDSEHRPKVTFAVIPLRIVSGVSRGRTSTT